MVDALDVLRVALSERYALDRELGRGGTATVYLAQDLKHRRLVAIKVLRTEVASWLGPDRFLREIHIAAQLQHPHILPLYDSGETDGVLYYVMPFVDGESLRGRLDRERQLPLETALQITREVADALTYAHSRGVVHRDIKPENILFSRGSDGEAGHALVTDFGIARSLFAAGNETLTQAGTSVGTPSYMSPEQASAEGDIDGRADVYSLACVSYEMLAGHPPFLGGTAREIMARHSLDPVPPLRTIRPDLPAVVERAVQRALAKAPADRFPTVAAFNRALNATDGSATSTALSAGGALVMAAALAILVIGYVVVSRQRASQLPTVQALDIVPSIAVLPFENVGGDPRNEPFSDGVAEDLTTALRKVSRLSVKARTSAFGFKRLKLTAQQIGKRLGARFVLTGSVQLEGNRRRVHAQLIDVAKGNELWSDKYDGDVRSNDVFAVQDTITRAIVASLRVPLSTTENALLEQPSTKDREAHDLYLQGRYFFEKRDEASLAKARGYFERAIQRDSFYAGAYSGLSDTYSHSSVFGYVAPHVIRAKAKTAALRALALDSTLVEGHTSLGFVALFLEWDFPTAQRAFDRALQLDPGYAPAHQFRGWYLIAANRPDDAVEEMRTAARLDPFSLVIDTRVATMLFFAHRYDEAVAQARHTLELDSTFFSARWDLGRALLYAGACGEAVSILERGPRLAVSAAAGALGRAYARCGRRNQSLAELDRLAADAAQGRYVSHHARAAIYAELGDKDRAFRELDSAFEERAWAMFTLRLEPAFDGLRGDPRFARLLRRVGLIS